MTRAWHILTGEYPPVIGGVGDYSRLIARHLALAGEEVHVWAPSSGGTPPEECGVVVHGLPDHFGRAARAMIAEALRQPSAKRRILLVQYVPHAFGCRAMNIPFCWWLWQRRDRHNIWVMFHEVAFPLALRQRPKYQVLGTVTRLMAVLAARSAQRIFVSIPAWRNVLSRWVGRNQQMEWLPVPSTLPTQVTETAVQKVRQNLGFRGDAVLLGHFGTYPAPLRALLDACLVPLLKRRAERTAILLGRGSSEYAQALRHEHPLLAEQIKAPAETEAQRLAEILAACDLLLQPYPDGASCRRTSLMAGLALGRPIVTTHGPLSEPIWAEEKGVALATKGADAICTIAEDLLNERERREDLGVRGMELYRRNFAIENTINVLLDRSRDIDPRPSAR